MNLPRPMVKAVEAMMKAADTRSCLGMAEACTFAHDSIYRALSQRLEVFFAAYLALCKGLGGLTYGYLVLDDVVLSRWQSGRLGLGKLKDPATGQYVHGFSVVLLLWTNGRFRLPLAFRLYFGDDWSKGSLALALLRWAAEVGFRPECVLLDAWYASRTLLNEIQPCSTRFMDSGGLSLPDCARIECWMDASLDTMARPSGSKRANCGGLASWSRWCVGEGTTSVPMPCA